MFEKDFAAKTCSFLYKLFFLKQKFMIFSTKSYVRMLQKVDIFW